MTWTDFLYYGKNSLQVETLNDLQSGCIQPKRSLFFNRQDSCGISDYENYPNGFALSVSMKAAIVKWIQYRNGYVSNENPDRRVAVSQNTIEIQQSGQEVKLDITYIPFTDFKNPQKANIGVI
jgi:hypothetical protein